MHKTLSVSDVASICNVQHSTVGNWIRRGKVRASKIGRVYAVSTQELIHYLKKSGQAIPEPLQKEIIETPPFGSFKPCWKFWNRTHDRRDCDQCIVFRKRWDMCFITKSQATNRCRKACHECRYYHETYLARIQFINQINSPALVHRNMFLIGGNNLMAEVLNIPQSHLIGMGIENIIHPDSLGTAISHLKLRALGDPQVPNVYSLNIKTSPQQKTKASISVHELNNPKESFFVLVNSVEDNVITH